MDEGGAEHFPGPGTTLTADDDDEDVTPSAASDEGKLVIYKLILTNMIVFCTICGCCAASN